MSAFLLSSYTSAILVGVAWVVLVHRWFTPAFAHQTVPSTVRVLTRFVDSPLGRQTLATLMTAPGQRGGHNTGLMARFQRDPLRHHRAVVGPDARVAWWERARAFILLLLLVVGLGAAFAAFIGAVILFGRVLLETLAG